MQYLMVYTTPGHSPRSIKKIITHHTTHHGDVTHLLVAIVGVFPRRRKRRLGPCPTGLIPLPRMPKKGSKKGSKKGGKKGTSPTTRSQYSPKHTYN